MTGEAKRKPGRPPDPNLLRLTMVTGLSKRSIRRLGNPVRLLAMPPDALQLLVNDAKRLQARMREAKR